MNSLTHPIDVLRGSTIEHYNPDDTDLVRRWAMMKDWCDARLRANVESYSKYTATRIAPEIRAFDRGGRACEGANFASQEYLSLASDPRVLSAAFEAAQTYGVHSAGSAALMGLTQLTIDLERKIAAFLGVSDATVFPTGWGAGYGVIKTLVTPADHVVIDVLAHACLQEGATGATGNVHRYQHCSNQAVERRLSRIRRQDPDAGILVVSETVFSMDSDVPDLATLQALCRRFNATLLIDVAHDLGAIGPSGRGHLELQDMVGKIDIVMGSFSKTFASNGGFVATDRGELKLALRYACGPLTFTNSLSPMQAASVLACLEIIDSPEGARRRERLMSNIRYARARLSAAGFNLLGQESPIIPVVLGDSAVSRTMTGFMLGHGAIVNLVEYPAVSRNGCRWRIQVMHDHTHEQIDRLVRTAVAARDASGVDAGTGDSSTRFLSDPEGARPLA